MIRYVVPVMMFVLFYSLQEYSDNRLRQQAVDHKFTKQTDASAGASIFVLCLFYSTHSSRK